MTTRHVRLWIVQGLLAGRVQPASVYFLGGCACAVEGGTCPFNRM